MSALFSLAELGEGEERLPGCRLLRLEVLNWGALRRARAGGRRPAVRG